MKKNLLTLDVALSKEIKYMLKEEQIGRASCRERV